jgi:hypothetical protein
MNTKIHAVNPEEKAAPIKKPSKFSLDQFKSQVPSLAGVETLQAALPIMRLSDANDFVRLHEDETSEYWTPELAFVMVPVPKAPAILHLIDTNLAARFLQPKNVLCYRLALASKPFGAFFLCPIPTANTDNIWNATMLQAAQQAKTLWTKALSRKAEGAEGYKIERSEDPDAFDPPVWPTQTMNELLEVTFTDRMIQDEDCAPLRRLRGLRAL